MKKTLIAVCAALLLAPASALADTPAPAPAQLANAAKICKALKAKDEAAQMAALGGKTFAQLYGTRKNAHGKCVSDQAKKLAGAAAAKVEANATTEAKSAAATNCRTWANTPDQVQTALDGKSFAETYGKGKNAYGKCVSDQAKAGAEQVANAAKRCKQWSNASLDAQKAALDGSTFAEKYGTAANAYGKCVSDQVTRDA